MNARAVLSVIVLLLVSAEAIAESAETKLSQALDRAARAHAIIGIVDVSGGVPNSASLQAAPLTSRILHPSARPPGPGLVETF